MYELEITEMGEYSAFPFTCILYKNGKVIATDDYGEKASIGGVINDLKQQEK